MYVSIAAATARHSGSGVTDNDNHLNDINRPTTPTAYERQNENTQAPANYQQLPPHDSGHQHDYSCIDNSPNINNEPQYLELKPSVVYEQLH